jgi:integrase
VAGAGEPAQIQGAPASETAILTSILNFKLYLQAKGRQPETLNTIHRRLTQLSQIANLNSPPEVALKISQQAWSKNTKRNFTAIYDGYRAHYKLHWENDEKPIYRKQRKIPFIPTEQEIDSLIASSGKRSATLLQFLKETASRLGEATRVEWTDIDFQRKLVNINHPEKGSLPITLPISDKLIHMINQMPRNRKTIFSQNKDSLRSNFDYKRKTLADKLNNPRILKIHFHTLRAWKATMTYHDLKDMKEVQTNLGHTNSASTDIYIVTAKNLFLQETDEWVGKICNSIEEELQCVNAGFQYIRTINETKTLYRKRK